MTTYVPGTMETDPKKQNMSLQQIGPKLDTAISDVAANTTEIATNTADIATLQARTGAAPSATVNLTATNGSAVTYTRSDGAPALAKNLVDAGPTFAGLATIYNGLFVSTNGFATNEMFGSNIVGLAQAITGGIEIPSSANFGNHSTGIAGYARTSSTGVGAVGIFGQGTVNGSGTGSFSAFGGNFVATNTPNQDSGSNTGFNAEVYGIEVDINLKKRATVAPAGNVRGIYLQNNGAEVQPTGNFTAFEVDGGGTVAWKAGFYTSDGSVSSTVSTNQGGINLGATGTGNGVGSQPIVLRSRTAGAVNGTSSISADSSGNVTIAPSTNGAIVLFNDGTSTTLQATSGSSGVRFNQYGAGSLSTSSTGVITATSDARLKNVTGPFTRGLADILAMDAPVTYQWLEEMTDAPEARYSGWTAQGVQKGIPEAVNQGPDGYLTLSERPIIAALVNAVRELSAELEQLRSQLA